MRRSGKDSRATRVFPIEHALKDGAATHATFVGIVAAPVAAANAGQLQAVDLRGPPQSCADEDSGSRDPVRLILPRATADALSKDPHPALAIGRGVRLQQCKAISAHVGKFVAPTESMVIGIDTRKEIDAAYLAHHFGVHIARDGTSGEPELRADADPASSSCGGMLCGCVTKRHAPPPTAKPSWVGGFEIAVSCAAGMHADAGVVAEAGDRVHIVLQPCHLGVADALEIGDLVLVAFPKGWNPPEGQAKPRANTAPAAMVPCPRGTLFHTIDSQERGLTSFEEEVGTADDAQGARALGGVVGRGGETVVIGVALSVAKAAHVGIAQTPSQSRGLVVRLTLSGASGTRPIEMRFARTWSAGLVEPGHMVALSGITCARDGEENEREVWNEEAGSRLFNLSRMHALLTSSMFLEPVPLDAKALLSTRAYKATLQAIKGLRVRTFHKRCMRMVEKLIINIACESDDDDGRPMECLTQKQTRTPETPSGIFECRFCGTDCGPEDVTLGYTGSVQLGLAGAGTVTCAVDSPALGKLIEADPLRYKAWPRSQRELHGERLKGTDVLVCFYRRIRKARRLWGREAQDDAAGELCVSMVHKL